MHSAYDEVLGNGTKRQDSRRNVDNLKQAEFAQTQARSIRY